MNGFVIAVVALVPLSRAPTASAQEPSLESFLAAPAYTSLTASPDGGRFAWVENRRGARTVWLTAGARYEPVQVARFERDDGQQVAQLSFSRDGRVLAFVRGGPPGYDGVVPDPASTPAGARMEIWTWREGGEARRFGPGTAPDLSADGSSLAFLRGGKIFVGPVSEPDKAAAAVEVRGRLRRPRWSPDGSRLAFVSDRGDHALVGVYAPGARSVTWMAPSFQADASPAWSPDGGALAFLRLPSDPVKPSLKPETDGPFEIWVADPGTGKGRRAFRSPDRSAGWAQEDGQLLWAAGDLLIFPWEGDGWTRLFAVPAKGGAPVALSPPRCEAVDARLGPDGRQVAFSANCGDLDRSHVWLTWVQGGEPRNLTPGGGVETSPAFGAGAVLLLAATARRPGVPSVVDLGSATGPRPLAADALTGFPLGALVEPEIIALGVAKGVEVRAQLFTKPGVPGRRPAVVYVHGGPQRQMFPAWHPMDYYLRAYALNQYLAWRGFLVLSVNFRGGTGYGRDFRSFARSPDRMRAALQDVVAAARYLRGRGDVDPARIGIWGGSYGGYLTAHALAGNSDLFAAGVDLHGLTDTYAYYRDVGLIHGWDPADQKLAHAASPIADLSRWRSPVLVIHGDHDSAVRFSQSADLVQRLASLPRPPEVEALLIPDEVHLMLRFSSWVSALGAAAEFLERRLGSEPPR